VNVSKKQNSDNNQSTFCEANPALMSKIQSLLAGPVTPQRLWEIM
jgi:hypothetical protein